MLRSCIRTPRLLKNQKGAHMVEFSIIALVFFTLIFGIIEFGLLIYNQQVITNAGREAARFGVVARPIDSKIQSQEIVQEAVDYAENFIITFGDKNFEAQATFESNENYCREFKDVLTVEVSHDYSFVFLPFATKKMETKSVMRCE